MTKNNLTNWVLSLLAFCLTSMSFAQIKTSKIDSLLSTQFDLENAPGAVFLVAHKGQPIYHKAFGYANLELQIPMQTHHVFQLGSMTKQFTAVAILMLEAQGKLKIEAPISKYIPEYPNGDQITLHHLLNHSSGLQDFTKLKVLRDIAQKQHSPEALVALFKDAPQLFETGSQFEYNNSGYVLLGYLIERISGMTYETFINTQIFEPLEMTHSYYASDRTLIPNRASGYHNRGGYVNKYPISFSIPYASGALMSTTEDLLRWQNALNTEILIPKTVLQKAFMAHDLDNGTATQYGYGWHIRKLNGYLSREHGGSIFGFKSMGVYIPEKDLYVIGLSNCDCNSPTKITKALTTLVLQMLDEM